MSQVSPISSDATPSSNFQSIFHAALDEYESKTGKNLLEHPLAAQLQSCNSPAEIIDLLQGLVQQFNWRRKRDERITNWLNPVVTVLYAFSTTLCEGIGLLYPPARPIFTGIGVLLLAAKEVDASQDNLKLIGLFIRIEYFFRRLEFYTEVVPTAQMMNIIAEIMLQVLSTLAVATEEINQGRTKKFMKKLLGKNDIENSLNSLDTLTLEEARMAVVEVWRITNNVNTNVNGIREDGEEIREVVEEVSRRQLLKDIRKWLSPPNYSTNHNTARSVQHEVTATWFLEGLMYEQWKSDPSLLWITGKPGSGKTILCSEIIQDIMALKKAKSVSMAYFYCDSREKDKQSHRDLLLSILCQLSGQSDPCFAALSKHYSEHDEGAQQPSDTILVQCLKDVLFQPAQAPVYLIVDALDEFPRNSGISSSQEQVLELVKDLAGMSPRKLHLCVTSCYVYDIKTTLEALTPLRVSLHEQIGQTKDIVNYIRTVVYSDVKMRAWSVEDKGLVIEALSKGADGMYRLVYCQLEALRHCLPASVPRVLDELPKTLDETYERILGGINEANREHAQRLLQCVAVAVRPLRVEELAEVLAVDFAEVGDSGIPKLKPNWRSGDQYRAVLSTCSSLITIVERDNSRVVQFSHLSVKKFLMSDRFARSRGDISGYQIVPSLAHTILALACLAVLLHLDGRNTKDNAGKSPLIKYAARYWVDHAQYGDVSSHIRHMLKYFFDADKPHWAAWLSVFNIDKKSWRYFTSPSPHCAKPIYYAALCGFYDLAKHLISRDPEHVHAMGGKMVTPLGAALYGKHFHVADLLHEHHAQVDVRGGGGQTPLHAASRAGLVDIVKWLLDHGADVNAEDNQQRVPLFVAACRGHLEICRVLLEKNANIHARNRWGETPLHGSACPIYYQDQLSVMQLLLDHSAEPNALDINGSTPLHYSSFWQREGHLEATGTVEGSRLLLERGAKVDIKNIEGKTPLQLALQAEYHEMVKFLRSWGQVNTERNTYTYM